MTFGIGYCRGPRTAAVVSGEEAPDVVVAVVPAHCKLARGIVYICPLHLAVFAEGCFFLASGEVFVDVYAVGFDAFNNCVQAFHSVDTALVVLLGSSGYGVAVVVAKSFYEVKAETVDIVFSEPVFECVGPLLLHQRVALVPVVEHGVFVGRGLVVERIGADGIHLVPRVKPVALVEHYVEYHGDAVAVAFLDKVFVVGRRAVCLVGCHIEVGVVAPGVVAVKFHDGHQFHGIEPELFDVWNLFDGLANGAVACCYAVGAGEVAEEHLVNHEVGVVGYVER